MFTFLLVVQALIAAVLVGVILMQQSEGGGLGMGGSPSGLMSARGAANFLTRATGILAVIFVTLSIVLAVVATQKTAPTTIDTSLARQPLPAAPLSAVPLSGTPAPVGTVPATSETRAPVVPLAAPTPAPRSRPEVSSNQPRAAAPTPAAPAVPRIVPTTTAPPQAVAAQPAPAPTTSGNSN